MTTKFSERAAEERRRRKRLNPSANTSENFARMLAARFVPVKISSDNPYLNAVPGCCAEFYKTWLNSSSSLAKLKLDTVADIARDAFVAEGGKLTASLDFETSKASNPLVWAHMVAAAKNDRR